MRSGILQRNVAITPFRSSRLANSDNLIYCVREAEGLRSVRRWQSTTTKDVSVSNNGHSVFPRNEIPPVFFVETSTFPDPSLSRIQTSSEIDLTSTRPAVLDSPAPLKQRDYSDGNIPIGDRAKYFFKLGKSYLSFYKTGLKNVWSNSKTSRALARSFNGHSLNTVARYGGQTINNKTIPQIDRAAYQLCLRTRHDLFKMIPFSLVFVICGEFTPLAIVALGSSIVPYTCRIPRQESKDLEKKLRQDKQYMEDLPRLHPDIEQPLEVPNWRIEHLEAFRLGLTSFRNPIPLLGPLWHALLTRPKLTRHCNNIVSDSILIHRQGGAFKLSYLDIYEWADAYGLYALRQYVEKCQKSGQDPKSEALKTELLPKVDAEIRYMLREVADWSRLKPNEQWRVGLRTVGSTSPDWQARMKDVRKIWKQA